MAEMTLDQQRALALANARLRLQGSDPAPDSVENAAAVRGDMYPTVRDRFSQQYDPKQSTGGFIANELGKSALGVLSAPQAFVESAEGTPLFPLSAISSMVRQRLNLPGMDRIAQILGIDPEMKAPGPGAKAIANIATDVGQNFLVPGGSTAQKVVGGIGSAVGRMAGADGGMGGEIAGSIAGGIVAPAALTARFSALQSIAKTANKTVTQLQSELQSNPAVMSKVRRDVLNELAESLRKDPDAYAAKFSQAQDLERTIPGLKLNLGQSFEAPSVLQKQRALEVMSPDEMNAAQARRTANEAVLRKALGEQPGARAGAESAITGTTNAAAARSRDLAAQISKTADEAQAISARFAQADMPALGQKALDIRASELGKARAKANELIGLATKAAEQEGAQFDIAPVVAKARQALAQPVWDDANTTSVFNKLQLQNADAGGFDWNPVGGATPRGSSVPTVGFDGPNGIKGLREAVNADIAAALKSNSPNARMQLRNLEQLKSEIDSVIKNSPFEQTKKAYGSFVYYYRTDFAPCFLRGANLMPEKTTALGETRLPPEKVFATYFKPNGGTEISRYLKLYGENPEAMGTLREAIVDRYAKEVMKDGVIDPANHSRFMGRYKVPLAALDRAGFKFGADIQDVSKSLETVTDRMSALKDAAGRADKDLVRSLVSDQFGAKAPEQVISEILPDPRKTNMLLSRMDKNQARGLVEFMKDDLVKQFSKDGQISPDAIDAFLGDRMKVTSYRNALAKVYSPGQADAHVKTLKDIAEASKRLNTTPVPTTAAVQGKPTLFHDELQKKTGLSIAVIGNMMRAVVAGRVSPEWAAMALGSQAGATVMQNMRNSVYAEVLKDPQSAKLLLEMMNTPATSGRGIAAATNVLKRIPEAMNFFVGLDRYPNFAVYATANFGREQSEQQLIPTE